jgi:hypothetical protein
VSTDYAISGDYGDQLSLNPNVPRAGDRYQCIATRHLVTVLRVQQRRRVWVQIRSGGREREIKLEDLAEWYVKV